ncbi:Heterokaryon incompatibility domain-containing protein [Pleurotus pulmonarius]
MSRLVRQSVHTPPLCERCQILQLDDRAQGGEISADSSYVTFGEPGWQSRKKLLFDYNFEDEYPLLPGLSDSANRGCAFCALLKEAILEVERLKNPSDSKIVFYKACYHLVDSDSWKEPKNLDSLSIIFKLHSSEGKEQSHALRFDIQAETNDPCARWLNIRRRPLASHPLSEHGIQRINELVKQSLQHFPYTHSYLPTRLIDVGSQHEVPRLIISNKHPPLLDSKADPESKRYIALSYCWGPLEEAKLQLKTERKSLDERLQGIPPDTLPQTLLDAVLVCRALGVRYVWIDSLCIIQGDIQDWERESGKMANVYRNAFLTICAVQGQSCLSGFLGRELPPQALIPFKSTLDPSITGRFAVFSAPTSYIKKFDTDSGWSTSDWISSLAESAGITRHRHPKADPEEKRFEFASPAVTSPFENDLDEAPWMKRAWTFQEAVLSPRMIIFGTWMVHLSHGRNLDSEDGTSDTHFKWGNSWATIKLRDQPAQHAKESWVPSHGDWYQSVARYSARLLSYQNDRLPAISALASTMSESLGGEFLAGLWTRDLHRGLLWAHFGVTTPEKYLAEASEYIAPSWSWACQPNMVGWVWGIDTLNYNQEFEYLGNDFVVTSEDPFGRVNPGKLILSAQIRKLPSVDIHRDSAFLGFIFPYVLTSNGEYIAHLLFDWRHSSSSAPKDPETGEEREDGPIDRLSMVFISSRSLNTAEWRGTKLSNPQIMLGLLLLPTTPTGRETEADVEYRRVGIWYSETKELGGRQYWDDVEFSRVVIV